VDEQSIWKKEISFGRKKKPEAVGADAEAPVEKPASIWKKEISLGRRKQPADAAETVEVADTPAEKPASIWKKEISLGRKKKPASATEPAEVAPQDSGQVQGTVPETGPEEAPSEEQTWTRAVSFGRKAAPVGPVAGEPEVDAVAAGDVPGSEHEPGREEPVALEVVRDEPEVADDASGQVPGAVPETGPEESPSEETWTRAVSFGRKATPVEPVAGEPEMDAVASGDVPGSDHESSPKRLVAAEAVNSPEESPSEEQTWTRAVSFGRKADPVADEPEVDAVASGDVLGSEHEPGPEEPVALADAQTETWNAVPSMPPAPEPQPEPVVHPPVPAAELSAPEPEQKVPFWKKDISFGGGKKRQKPPKAERAPKEPKQKKLKAPKEAKERKPKTKVKAPRGARGAKRLVGLKIGASQLAAARVSNNGLAELLQVAREPLDPGIVVGGELRDPDALAEALKEFFAKHKLPKKGVRLGIANNRIGVRTFDVAGISDQKQLTNAIRFRAQEALPIPIDEAVLDYQVLGESVDDEGRPTKRILLVVAYRELIDRYVDACKKAGIGLVGIDLEAFALLRALQAPQEGVGGDSSAALVAVAIGHERSTFAVSDGRVCEFTRVLEWGGSALNVAIARALDAAPSEVEGAKRALALTDEMVPDGLTAEQAKQARDAMRRAIQTFARELVSSLQYYQNQPGSLGIGEIALTGGTAHLPGLAGELERLIGVRVRVGDPLARMKVSKKLGETEQIGSLAVAIGLGIED
jgi:type IV pilus assembly protein PilM